MRTKTGRLSTFLSLVFSMSMLLLPQTAQAGCDTHCSSGWKSLSGLPYCDSTLYIQYNGEGDCSGDHHWVSDFFDAKIPGDGEQYIDNITVGHFQAICKKSGSNSAKWVDGNYDKSCTFSARYMLHPPTGSLEVKSSIPSWELVHGWYNKDISVMVSCDDQEQLKTCNLNSTANNTQNDNNNIFHLTDTLLSSPHSKTLTIYDYADIPVSVSSTFYVDSQLPVIESVTLPKYAETSAPTWYNRTHMLTNLGNAQTDKKYYLTFKASDAHSHLWQVAYSFINGAGKSNGTGTTLFEDADDGYKGEVVYHYTGTGTAADDYDANRLGVKDVTAPTAAADLSVLNLSRVLNSGSVPDDTYQLRVSAKDYAGHQTQSDTLIKVDVNAPCDGKSQTQCHFNFDGSAFRATSAESLEIFPAVGDASGSGVDASKPVQFYVGACEVMSSYNSTIPSASVKKGDCSINPAEPGYIHGDYAALRLTRGAAKLEDTLNSPMTLVLNSEDATVNNFGFENDGIYTICAGYKDIAGNSTLKDVEYLGGTFADKNSGNTCGVFILDRTAPGKPTPVSLIADADLDADYDNNPVGSDPAVNNASFGSGVWTNSTRFQLKWTNPDVLQYSAISRLNYESRNYETEPSGSSLKYVPIDDEHPALPGQNSAVELLLPITQQDGMYAVHFWLQDQAGNSKICEVDSDGDGVCDSGKLNYSTIYFNLDRSAPEENQPITGFFSLSGLAAAESNWNQPATNPSDAIFANADLTNAYTGVPTTNLGMVHKTKTKTDSIVVFWPVTTDEGPSGLEVYDSVNNKGPYHLCYSQTMGECTNHAVSETLYNNSATVGYTLTDNQRKALTSGSYYFYTYTKDKAGNISDRSPIAEVTVDYDTPCWPSDGDGLPNGGGSCSVTAFSQYPTLDFSSLDTTEKANLGMSTTGYTSPIISYHSCNDSQGSGAEACDQRYSATNYSTFGGLRVPINLIADDGPSGSGFDNITMDEKNVMVGVGLDVWHTGSQQEAIFWHKVDRDLLSGPQKLASGNLALALHFFEGVTNKYYDPTVVDCSNDPNNYFCNPPSYGTGLDGEDFTDAIVGNVQRVLFTSNDGREILRNIYVRVKDAAGNWSVEPVGDYKTNYVVASIVVDTAPPARLTRAFNQKHISIGVNGTQKFFLYEDTGLLKYFPVSGAPVSTAAEDRKATMQELAYAKWPQPAFNQPVNETANIFTNSPSFDIEYVHPVDLSAFAGVSYKFTEAPTGPADKFGYIGTKSGKISITIPGTSETRENFPYLYLWGHDTIGNPDTNRVTGLENYYKPGSDECTTLADGNIDYVADDKCRVIRVQLPYDGTKPAFESTARVFLDSANKNNEQEATFIPRPEMYFTMAADTLQAPKESGIRPYRSYKLCYGNVIGDCDVDPANPNDGHYLWIDEATNTKLDTDSNGTPDTIKFTPPTDLLNGNWYFHVKAFDYANNESAPSPGKKILVDTAEPCALAGENCSLSLASNSYSTKAATVAVALKGSDSGAGVDKMILAEYIDNSGTCFATYLKQDGTTSDPVAQGCSGSVDRALLPVEAEIAYTETASFTLSIAADGIKKMNVFFRDAGGKWMSAPLASQIILDRSAPAVPAITAINPTGWGNGNIFGVYLSFPSGAQEDLSSQGGTQRGIAAAYYKIGSPPANDGDGKRVILEDMLLDAPSGTYALPVEVYQAGVRPVYIWLEDAVGNKQYMNNVTSNVQYDNIRPATVTGITVNSKGTSLATPTITWEPSSDAESGLRSSNTYRLCYDQIMGNCQYYADVTTKSYTVSSPLVKGTWYFYVVAFDQAGNPSLPSTPRDFILEAGEPRLAYLGMGDYVNSAVYPRDGSEGNYTFRVLYKHPYNLGPETHAVKIDKNGDGYYAPEEVFAMEKTMEGTYGDGEFDNQEEYTIQIPLSFPRASGGRIRYQFDFSVFGVQAQGDTLSGNKEYELKIIRYNADFDGVAQVRNNVQRPGMQEPVVIVLNPPQDSSQKVFVYVISKYGKMIRRLADGDSFSSFPENYMYWDRRDNRGQEVSSGTYFVIVRIGQEEKRIPVVIVR